MIEIIFLLILLTIILNLKKIFSLRKTYIFLYKLKNLLKKKDQKYFYLNEKFLSNVKINDDFYLKINNYIFPKKNSDVKSFNLNKKIKQVIFVIYSKKKKYFNYILDSLKFRRLLHNQSFNFLKINVNNKNKIKINDDYDYLSNPIFIKKKSKKKLVLLLMVDGYGNHFKNYLPNTNRFFDNYFTNAWSNAEWTLPSFSNLITGLRTSQHKCYQNLSYYSNYLNIKNYNDKIQIEEKNIFEYFQELGFITSCFSPYVRINPTYGFNKGVDIFKYCENNTAEQILENVIAQLELFKEGSNFIFAHIFDTHSPVKNFMEISEFSKHPDKNYFYDEEKSHINIQQKKAVRVKDEFESLERISSFQNTDRKLNTIYNYLNKSKYDDFTILLFGDHGTRIKSKMKNSNILSENQNHISLHIKDKKFKKFKNKNNLIEIIDILPSLLPRYGYKKKLKNFDGNNFLFSKIKKNHSIAESVYEPFYQFNLRTKNMNILSKYTFKGDKIGNLVEENFYNSQDKKILPKNFNNRKEYNLIINLKKDFLKKNKLK